MPGDVTSSSHPGRLTWIGHATVLLEAGGLRIVTDPVLRDRVAHLVRRAPALDLGEVDVVLLSHLHRDHLDLPSLRRIGCRPTIVVPAGSGAPLRGLPNQVIELGVGAELHIAEARITAVRAVHEVRRTPGGRVTPAAGYVIDSGQRIYFAGDTECFDGMRALAPVDVALLPVWGWGTTLGPGHMDPDQAAAAAALIRPAVAVPIHWGTFLPAGAVRRHSELLRDPPERFTARVQEVAPDTRVEILRPGEALELGRPPLRSLS